MKVIRLEGKWTLSNSIRKISIPATIPGDNHSALIASKHIPDPYWARNELDVQWVAKEDWVFERKFDVPASLLQEKSVFLNVEGLDTIATIFINGQRAGQTNNMFLRYRLEVKPFLVPGKNEIRIEIKSPEKEAIKEAAKLPYAVPYNQFPIQSPHRNLIRKTQCHSGWDWGPCLMVSGIYGDIYLGAGSTARIEFVQVDQKHGKGFVDVEISCESFAITGGEAEFEVKLDGQTVTKKIQLQAGLNTCKAAVHISAPKLWWPNGYGKAHLYKLEVRVAGDTVEKNIGLRTLEIQNQESDHGLSMTFVVNGIPIFAKGANWIPTDALPSRQTREVVEDILASAVQANMNMIRVWGGGQYESEAFYDYCDRHGLLVWQEFIFACSLYPATKSFLENVRQEAAYQVKRLQHRACVAMWCGNNENVGALNWYEESRKNRDRYIVDYDRLNEGVLGNTVRELDPARMFWPSSPCGGPGDYSDCWHDDTRGDMHFWSVWHSGKPFEDYLKIKPRFCSEFGYQSFPSLDGIRSYAPKDQWNVTSPVMEHHQRNPGGNARITENFARYFRLPEGFENFVYLSQFQQALAIKIAVEHFRRLRPICMGALYWQLNDLWPVCSWGSLDYGGKWKVLHYAAKRFFAPVLGSVVQTEDGHVEIWYSSDLLKTVDGSATVKVLDFSGKVLRSDKFKTRVEQLSSKCIKRYRLADLAPEPDKVFLYLELKAGNELSRNDHFFAKYKECDLAASKVKMQVKSSGAGFEVSLSADRPAFGLTLEAEGIRGEFDDNSITLLPGQTRTLLFTPKQKTDLGRFKKSIKLFHLRKTYP